MDDFVQGVGVVALGCFNIVCATNVLKLVVVPNNVIVQALSVLVDFKTDRRVGGNPRNLHRMADNCFVVNLRNLNQVFNISFVKIKVAEVGVAGGVTEFGGDDVGVFNLSVGLCVFHFDLPFALCIAFTI